MGKDTELIEYDFDSEAEWEEDEEGEECKSDDDEEDADDLGSDQDEEVSSSYVIKGSASHFTQELALIFQCWTILGRLVGSRGLSLRR